MNFELGPDEELLIASVREALSRTDTLSAARSALEGAEPVHLWKEAVRGGWTDMPGLLYGVLVLIECGRRLAPTGLLGHLTTVAMLRPHAADATVAALLPSLLDGSRRAAIALTPPHAALAAPAAAPAAPPSAAPMALGGDMSAESRIKDDAHASSLTHTAEHTLSEGRKENLASASYSLHRLEHIPDAPGAGVLIADGMVLTDFTVEKVGGYDPSRPLGNVRYTSGTPIAGDAGFAWNVGQTLLAAEALGAAEAALALAVEYAKQRKAFGRAIGSFQAIKHQLTDALRLNENARSLLYYAAYAADSASLGAEPAEFELAANAARFAADQAIEVSTRRCLSVHGGIGATWEHDAHLYFRRAQLTRLLLGGQSGAGERVVRHVIPG